jgi:hypothetical protein
MMNSLTQTTVYLFARANRISLCINIPEARNKIVEIELQFDMSVNQNQSLADMGRKAAGCNLSYAYCKETK